MTETETLAEAAFHPNLRWYRFLQGAGVLIASVAGIAVLPIWAFAGWAWATRYYGTLTCELGERTLSIGYGVWFRTEKSIPLEQIQDVSVRHGPLLNWLGLTKLKVETAGQGSSEQAAGDLVGVESPQAFRDRVLEQRERLSDRRASGGTPAPAREAPARGDGRELVEVLEDIRDTLLRIEQGL